MKKELGFTLLEIFLVIGLISMIAALALPVYHDFQVRNDLENSLDMTVQTLRRAEFLAVSGDGNDDWGVYFQETQVTVFNGPSYAARDQNKDELFFLFQSVTHSGMNEIVFTKSTGIPTGFGDIVLTGANNEVRTISVNSKGMIEF